MDGKVFIFCQCQHLSFLNIMIERPSTICTWTWRVYNYVSGRRKGINRRNESTKLLLLRKIVGMNNTL